jgi:glycosyltransferase involved in cell wall biosynthesis
VTPGKPGVNLVGFVGGERGQGPSARLGLGEIVHRVARGLEHAGIPFVIVPYRPASSSATSDFARADAVYDTNLICLNADYLAQFFADAGPDYFTGKTSIGFWFWETSRFRPDPRTPLACLDEVWVASSYARDAVGREIDIPVFVAPLPMEASPAPTRSRSELRLPDGFLFLFVFNFISGVRKNPLAVLDAFTQAFAPGEGPILVLKSVNGLKRKPRLLAELEGAARGRGDVHVVDRYVSAEENQAMIASCDCYVSLHRSEGLGLTIAEAISHGKPVIATGYSGNLDFMDERSSYLVPYRQTSIPADWWAYVPGAEWAEPDIAVAARLMRRVWEHPQEARLRGERARDQLLERFTVDRTADFVSSRLAEMRVRGALATRTPGSGAREPILEASEVLRTDLGESLSAPSSRSTSRVRGILRRALWPYLERERELDAAMLRALVALQRSVEDLEQRVVEVEAKLSSGTTDRSPTPSTRKESQ